MAEVFIAFMLGIVGNFVAQWLLERRRELRTRRAMREALTAEIIGNLKTLDAFDRTFRAGLADPPDTPFLRWPTLTPIVSVLQQYLDPSASGQLTETEQGKIPLLLYQLTGLQADMTEEKANIHHGIRDRYEAYSRFLERQVPYIAQNLVDMLCNVVAQQDRFASAHARDIAARLLPVIGSRGPAPPRIWKTSDWPHSPSTVKVRSDIILAWRNDAPDKVPEGTSVVCLYPPEGADHVSGRIHQGRIDRFLAYVGHRRRQANAGRTSGS